MPTTPGETGGVLFWAEDSNISPGRASGRKAQKPKAKVHPFLASHDRLKEILGKSAGRNVVTLRLPTGRSGPQPSPQITAQTATRQTRQRASEADTNLTLDPWIVGGLWLPSLEALPVLLDLPKLERSPKQIVLGEDAKYWRIVSTVVLETIAAQKVVPVVERGKIGLLGRWRTVLDSPRDAQRIAFLERNMPPVCRAEEADGRKHPATPHALLMSFLNELTDSLARRWSWGEVRSLAVWQDQPAYRWLASLFRDEPMIKGTAAQLQSFETSYKAWMRNLHPSGDQTFRIAFRVEAPGIEALYAGENGSDLEQPIIEAEQGIVATAANGNGAQSAQEAEWTIHFLIQALDDPSLMINAEAIWKDTSGALSILGRRFEQPQEKLLAGLGYASRIFPPLAAALKSKSPTRVNLTTREAYAFLREAAPVLEEAGFGLLAPPWWNQRSARLGMRLRLSPAQKMDKNMISQGKLNLENLIRYRWELSLGETTLTEDEFRALAALKTPLIQIRGQWVQLDPEQIEAAIQFWEKQRLEGTVGLLDALQMGMNAGESQNGLPVDEIVTEDWLVDWLERFNEPGKLNQLPQPPGLLGELRPYQRYGYSWLSFFRQWGLGACLADDMGLGKTIQTIALLLKEKQNIGQFPQPVLLVAPTSVVTNWQREVDRFAPGLTTYVHQGPSRRRNGAFKEAIEGVDMVLTSYVLVRQDAEMMQSIDWHMVVLDEAQNIKNPSARQTQVIRKLNTGFRLALTGTPVENRLSELWSIMHFLNPGYLGTQEGFRQTFALPIERYADTTATEKLKTLVGPFILRRVKTDPSVIQDLPEKVETKVYCNLTEEQASLYQAVVEDTMKQVDDSEGIARRGLVLAMLMKLKQICNHPVQFMHQGETVEADDIINRSGKLERLIAMLEEILAEGDRALIFTQFAEMGELLKASLPDALGSQVQFLHGGTTPKQRDVMIRAFQEDPSGPPIFILSLKAGGTGLNLTRANHVFHFDRWWNPAVENQATDRAFRIGQHRNVQVHKFVTLGTLEEKIDEMIESKKGLAQAVIGSGESWLTELSTDDLRELVTLRKE